MKITSILAAIYVAFIFGLVGASPTWAEEPTLSELKNQVKRNAEKNRRLMNRVSRQQDRLSRLKDFECPEGEHLAGFYAYFPFCKEKAKPFVVRYQGEVAPRSLGSVIAWCPEGYIAVGGNVNLRPQATEAESLTIPPVLRSFGGQFPNSEAIQVGEGGEDGRPYYHPFTGWGAEVLNVTRNPVVVEAWAQCKYFPYEHSDTD